MQPCHLRSSALVAFMLGLLICGSSVDADGMADGWRNWRGPNLNGTANGTGYPVEWSVDKNLQWRVALPGPGASTPIVVGDSIFLTAEADGQNAVVCLAWDGSERWRQHVGAAAESKHRKATPCNSSPVSDGTHVVTYFKSGDFACHDLQGSEIWRKNLQEQFGENTLWWDLGTSPVIVDDLVVVTCQQTGPSYLAGFDLASGELRWKQDRQLPAPQEANQSYTTPAVVQSGERRLLVIVGADHITAHELTDGAEVWRVGDLNPDQNAYFRSIASPVFADRFVIAPYARGTTLTAVRLDGKGDVTDTHVAWQTEGNSADVPSPAYDDGKLFIANDKGTVSCLDANNGEEIWASDLPKSRTAFSSSPILADGRLYMVREDGVTFVLDANSGELLATNELEGLTVATPVFVDGRILVRTVDELFCLSK